MTWEPLKLRFREYTQVAFLAGQWENNGFPVPVEYLKHLFLDLTNVEIWACQEQIMIFKFHSTAWIFSLSTWRKSHFWLFNKQKIDFKVPFDNLKHRYFDFIQLEFLPGQEAENEFAVPCNH